jgi:Flp pilus assembly protein TadB
MTDVPLGTPDEAPRQSPSLGDLIGEVTRDFSTLMRQELELAKAELRESGKRAGKGGGMLAGASVAGYFALLFLSIALWWAIGYLTGLGWSAVIVAVIWAIVALVLALQGKRQLESMKGMPQTADTLKKIPETLKPNGDNS